MRVLLVSMPWHALDRPSLGLGLLQAALRRDGHDCDIRYLGFELADSIGIDDYLWVHGELPYTAFAGDWLFTAALYGDRPESDIAYVDDVLRRLWRRPERDIARLALIRRRIVPFLEHCDRIPWQDYDLVGFTSTFEQNIASLALAQRVALHHPEVLIAFGGANWEGEMGEALHRRFGFVDVVASGEADLSFPALVNALRDGSDPATIPGLVVRSPGGASHNTGDAPMLRELDLLPIPSYDDFTAQREASPAAVDVLPTLLLETSRGCWWGAKHHCTFCGLNGGTMAFRSKSAERVLREIAGLRRQPSESVAVVDNILDMRYFSTVLPVLAEQGAPLGLFYEVKANLTRGQVRMLARAGVRHVQPGIESLSDSVLKLMRKGTTALQNVQMLKWCTEYGVQPEWNFLYGFPGEDPGEYARMADLMEAIGHLPAPSGQGPVRLDRFSPYHQDPASFAMVAVESSRPYRYLYEAAEDELMKIAYYFDFEYADGRDLGYAALALERVHAWAGRGRTGTLTLSHREDGSALVLDSRDGAVHGHALEPWQADILDSIDGVATESAVLRGAVERGIAADDAADFLHACERLRIAAHVGDRWLGLPVHDPPRWEEPAPQSRALLQVLT